MERGQFDLLYVQQSQLLNPLTLSHDAGGGAFLHALTVRDILPRGRHCCRLSHLDWRQWLWLHVDPQHCRSEWRWLVGRGGLRLYVSGGLGHAFRAAGRWWAGRAAGGVEGTPRTADQDQLWAAAALLHLPFLGPSICHGRVAGRTRETRGEVNKQSFNEEHRIHYHIDELTDKDSGKTQGLWTHNTIKGSSIRWGANQTQMGMNELMTGNRKDHIWVWKHKEKEDKVWQLLAIATNIPKPLMTGFGQGHIYNFIKDFHYK